MVKAFLSLKLSYVIFVFNLFLYKNHCFKLYLDILNFVTVPQNGKTHLKIMEIKITHMQSAFFKG